MFAGAPPPPPEGTAQECHAGLSGSGRKSPARPVRRWRFHPACQLEKATVPLSKSPRGDRSHGLQEGREGKEKTPPEFAAAGLICAGASGVELHRAASLEATVPLRWHGPRRQPGKRRRREDKSPLETGM